MLETLEIKNVGPAAAMRLCLGERLNVLTGDNGLGKSFLLDIAWWVMTRKWPAEINPRLTAGRKAVPASEGPATIEFAFTGKVKTESYESEFLRRDQAWTGRPGRPANPGLVLYAMSDGGFAVWDPARNYWRTRGDVDVQDRPPAYVFSPTQVWDGLPGEEGQWLCNGLIRDWAGWQKEENGVPFRRLRKALRALSPSGEDILTPGELTRISLDDVRDMPTVSMPYGQDVPLVHASAGIRRIVALAYLLIWAWEEHRKASRVLGEKPTDQVIFLIDEIESHLHPRWQFQVLPSLLEVVVSLTRLSPNGFFPEYARGPEVQILTATHSPMILASIEPVFNAQKDAWFDLDYSGREQAEVVLTRRAFERHGDVSSWLTSEAFDLASSRNPEYARLLNEAADLLEQSDVSVAEATAMEERLVSALSPKDPFLFRWRGICARKGLLP